MVYDYFFIENVKMGGDGGRKEEEGIYLGHWKTYSIYIF